MPRTNVAVAEITRDGVYPAGTAGTADGAMFTNNGDEHVEVVNANATTARTVTFVTPVQREGLDVADKVVTIPVAGRLKIGPFPVGYFNQQSGADMGKVYVNFDATAPGDLTLRVFRLPRL